MSDAHYIGMSVCNNDRESNGTQTLGIVDVIADVCSLRKGDSPLGDETRQLFELVGDTMQAESLELLCSYCDHGVRFGRQDDGIDSSCLEALETQAITPPAPHRFLALFGYVNCIVREDSIEVETDESNPVYAPFES